MDDMNPEGVLCGRCGQPAVGWAFINGKRYCHTDPSPSCYEQTEWGMVEGGGMRGMVQELVPVTKEYQYGEDPVG